jgi:Gpi18-like mannosyltransferase
VFAANRLLLLVIGLLTTTLFYDVPGRDHSPFVLWYRWDVTWYVRIAQHGYSWVAPPGQSDLAFFPLYPLCMRLLSLLTPLSAYAAGLLVSAVAFAACLYLLHRLVSLDHDVETADRAAYYLGFFPTAFFFFTAYSEALYLACSVACIYALRLRRWWVAGLCGMAAALTRQIGLLLLVPFAIEYVECWRRSGEPRARSVLPLLAGALIPLGLFLFMLYQQVALGNALLFLHAQQAWGRSLAAPWLGVVLTLQHIVHLNAPASAHTIAAWRTISLIDLSFLLLSLALLAYGATRLPRSYTAYAAVVWLAILINPATGAGQYLALLSTSRFALTVFPSFIALALLGRRRAADRLIVTACVALLALFAILFVRGRWIA